MRHGLIFAHFLRLVNTRFIIIIIIIIIIIYLRFIIIIY